jgi:biopolymer transport protein ExbB/TolQ
MGANAVALWAAMGVLAKVVVLGLAAMLVALPVLAVKLGRRGKGAQALGTIAASAPLLGVFGTVVGLINACAGIAAQETVPMRVIAAGIGEALVTTALGLAIALAALWLRAAFDKPVAGCSGEAEGAGVPAADALS